MPRQYGEFTMNLNRGPSPIATLAALPLLELGETSTGPGEHSVLTSSMPRTDSTQLIAVSSATNLRSLRSQTGSSSGGETER
jgi:hypothetical protein